MRVLIIEDEQPAARQLTKLLNAQSTDFQILETLDTVQGSVRWLKNFTPPDLIFMDIQIADGLSFDIFRQVEIRCPVVFTTAFDQYAVQAFKVNAIDYLLKPVEPEELARSLERVRQRTSQYTENQQLSLESLARFFQKENYKERFLIKNGQHFTFLNTAEIAFFRSSDGLTQAQTFPGKKFFVDHTLEELERLLDPRDFFRVSRNLTLRLTAIQKIHPHLNGRLKIETSPSSGEEVFVSRERAGEFKAWLGG